MIKDDNFAELIEHCAKMRHILATATEERDMDSWSGSVRKAINGLERSVNLPSPSLLIITSDIRIMRCIESRACEQDLQEDRSESTAERLIGWRTEMGEMLRAFDVCDRHSLSPQCLNHHREGLDCATPWRSAKLNIA